MCLVQQILTNSVILYYFLVVTLINMSLKLCLINMIKKEQVNLIFIFKNNNLKIKLKKKFFYKY